VKGIKYLIPLLVFFSICLQANADEKICINTKPFRKRFGFDFMAYPAGQVYGLRAEFENQRGCELNFRLGYNRAFRKNFSGLNDDEQGGGPGISVGARYYIYDWGFGTDNIDFAPFVGTRIDYWQLNIFWKDYDNKPPQGTTKISVIQPTFEIGIKTTINQKWVASVYAGFGQEINIVTKGDAVGQGGLWLGGITLCRNLWHWGKSSK
jgi:hypothetical protein